MQCAPVDDLALLDGLQSSLADLRHGAKRCVLRGERFLTLGVERRILHKTVHEHAQMVLDEVALDLSRTRTGSEKEGFQHLLI